MLRIFLISGYLFVHILALEGQELDYKIQNHLSSIKFTVIHMGFLEVAGEFREFEGLIKVSHNPNRVFIIGRINVNSINTENESRDETILNDGYLDSKLYPYIKYESTSFQKGDTVDVLNGNLTIRETSRNVKIPIKINTANNDAFSFAGELTILRSDFNLDFGPMDGLVADEVSISLIINGNRTQ